MTVMAVGIAGIAFIRHNYKTAVAFSIAALMNILPRSWPLLFSRKYSSCHCDKEKEDVTAKASRYLEQAVHVLRERRIFILYGATFLTLQMLYAIGWFILFSMTLVLRFTEQIGMPCFFSISALLLCSMAWSIAVFGGLLQVVSAKSTVEPCPRKSLSILLSTDTASAVAMTSALTAVFDGLAHVIEEEEGDAWIGIVIDRLLRRFLDTIRLATRLMYVLIGIHSTTFEQSLSHAYHLFYPSPPSFSSALSKISWSLNLVQFALAITGAAVGFTYNYSAVLSGSEEDAMYLVDVGASAVLSYWASSVFNGMLQAIILAIAVHEAEMEGEPKIGGWKSEKVKAGCLKKRRGWLGTATGWLSTLFIGGSGACPCCC